MLAIRSLRNIRAFSTLRPGVVNQLVLIRHGQSDWNKKNLFTGWVDVPLSDKGEQEARAGGKLIKEEGLEFDIAYTSVLKRAIKTLWCCLEESDQMWVPVENSWRLNERHYGSLQGLNKVETVQKYGEKQVLEWRRSYDIPPPPMDPKTEKYPCIDRRYKRVKKSLIPKAESLALTEERVLPFWNHTIFPQLSKGKRIIIAAHGNSLRALVKYLDNIPTDKITGLNIPTGVPLVYDFDKNNQIVPHPDAIAPLRGRYLGNKDEILARVAAVANQTKKN